MGRPAKVMVPDVGRSNPAIIIRVVVFPEPDGPRNVTNSPFSIVSDTPSTARTLPS